jgi:hypothetical protein
VHEATVRCSRGMYADLKPCEDYFTYKTPKQVLNNCLKTRSTRFTSALARVGRSGGG